MKGANVEIRGLTKHFGAIEALRSLDLQIEAGELVAFLGPSGCGKTTTLLLLAGIYKPTRGEILFDGERVDGLHPRDRDAGMVFQSYALYPHLSLFENIAFPLRLKRLPRDQVDRAVRQIADLLQIADQLDRRPAQVSGGQQQRAALARALVKEPRVLFLDEPLSNLDAQLRLQARGEIRRLQKDLGVTTILVTHDQAEALAMADRVAVLAAGELQQFDTPQELYDRPANTFVARFVGYPPMNLLEGIVADGFEIDELTLPTPGGFPRGLARTRGTLGIRPEDVRLEGGVTARVQVVEPIGRELLVSLDLHGNVIQALCSSRSRLAAGSEVGISFPPDRLHVFGCDGRRLVP